MYSFSSPTHLMLCVKIYDGKLINFSAVVNGGYTYLLCLILTLPPAHLLMYMFVIIQRFYLEIESEHYIQRNPYGLGIGAMWVMKKLVIEKKINNNESELLSPGSTRQRQLPDWV